MYLDIYKVVTKYIKTREDRNRFMGETAGMLKEDREKYYESFYN